MEGTIIMQANTKALHMHAKVYIYTFILYINYTKIIIGKGTN